MKIAIIAHLNFPISEPYFGGLEAHTHVLVQGLMRRGHDVTLFAREGSDESFSLRHPPRNVIDLDQEIKSGEAEGRFVLEFIDLMHTYTSIMLELRDADFDLVHNNCLSYVPLALSGILSCPIVTVFHSPPFPSLASGVILSKDNPHCHFVSVSDTLGREWEPHLTDYRVIHNGLKPENFDFSPAAEPATAIWFGRFCPEKGPEYAIRAARMAGYRLRLIGTVYDQAYFDTTIAPLLGEDVEFCGHMDHAQLSDAVGRASVGLFTSVWDEPFGLVVIEMLACGTPVVAFNAGAISEILTPDCGIIVPNRDAAAMATAIPEAVKLDRAACRRRAVGAFSVSRMVDDYERLYEELVPTKMIARAN